MRVAIVGGGAMGSLYAGRLAAGGLDATLVDRNADHVRAIDREGLTLVGAGGDRRVDLPATTDPAATGPADLVVVLVKSYDTADAVRDAAPLLDGPAEPAVLTLQNGLGNAEAIADRVPRERVLAGVTTAGATREAPGRVRVAATGETVVGRYFGPNGQRVRRVAERFTAAGVETRASDEIRRHVWEKVLVNVGINAPTALARVDNGALVEREPGERLLRTAVEEARRVARAAGHDVRADAADYATSVAERTASNVSSMRADLEGGGRTEVEALYGAVVERADRHDVTVPVTRTLADLVRLTED